METTNVDVILVNQLDEQVGTMEKLEAHQKGLLHRAFSIFLFNSKNEMLIHKRSLNKYHSAGLWTNACCSHPTPEQNLHKGLVNRLYDELRIDFHGDLKFLYSFVYKTDLENNLIEHELDHVFVGHFDQELHPNPEEVMDWKFISIPDLYDSVNSSPELFTFWFKEILNDPRFRSYLNSFS